MLWNLQASPGSTVVFVQPRVHSPTQSRVFGDWFPHCVLKSGPGVRFHTPALGPFCDAGEPVPVGTYRVGAVHGIEVLNYFLGDLLFTFLLLGGRKESWRSVDMGLYSQ